jgi:hypothetical protein
LIPSEARAFSEDEYQSCSGIEHDADKKTVVEWKDPTGASQAAEKLNFSKRAKNGSR